MTLKTLDNKILSELITNAKSSDRQIAKKLGVSQPTVTRRRARLEKELMDGYTAIPKWGKLGYEILAFTLVKNKRYHMGEEDHRPAHETAENWMMKQPNVIYSDHCHGMGMDGFMISFHKSYSDYDKFMYEHGRALGPLLDDIQTVIVNLNSNQTLKPFHFKYLAKELSE